MVCVSTLWAFLLVCSSPTHPWAGSPAALSLAEGDTCSSLESPDSLESPEEWTAAEDLGASSSRAEGQPGAGEGETESPDDLEEEESPAAVVSGPVWALGFSRQAAGESAQLRWFPRLSTARTERPPRA